MTLAAMQDAFLAEILANPDDDAVRLIFADWLQDDGQEKRAEFIQVQIEIAALAAELLSDEDCGVPNCIGCKVRRELQRRERELLDNHGFDWFMELVRDARLDEGRGPDRNAWQFRCLGGTPGWFGFRRGFFANVEMPCAAWRQHGPALVRAHPVGQVELSDKRPVERENGWTWLWYFGDDFPAQQVIPKELWKAVVWNPVSQEFTYQWPTEQAAQTALSAGCIRWARAAPLPGGGAAE